MKKIVFLTYHMGLQGSYINHLDFQQYLRDHEDFDIKFYCENVKKLFEIIKNSRRDYNFDKGSIKILPKEHLVEVETVVTDFKSLLMMHQFKKWIICNRLIVMDSIELTYHLKEMKESRFYYEYNLNEVLKHFYTKEIIFLMPPSNHKIFKIKYPDLVSNVFFKNINIDMIDTIKCENRDGYFYRWDDIKEYKNIISSKFGTDGMCYEPEWTFDDHRKVPLTYNEIDHIFDYKTLVYRRRKYLEYQEQFGRLIFEYILLGKTVYFEGEKFSDDGLTDYLTHFNIKFNDNRIITSREELREKMMKYHDSQLSFLRG